ncbi:MAG: DUF1905 domain-containing protein, partial [Chitinophagaceae bacterium]
MIKFTSILQRFDQQGEKTGWTYLEISEEIARMLKPGTRTTYRVKGMIDEYIIEQVSLVPMGEGNFILAVNAVMRKGIGKRKGAKVSVMLEVDDRPPEINKEFLACLD